MENYESKYKELVGKIEKAYMYAQTDSTKAVLEEIRPELVESEDEKIRKELIENFKWFCGDFPQTTKWGKDDNLLVKDIISWLEKQGEHNAINDTDEEIVEAVKDTSILDMVEPKFKVKNWIACDGLNTALIVNVDNGRYEVEFIDGNKGFPHIEYVDRNFHLWTIEDAKDGDVLQLGKVTAIFKEYIGNGNCRCYCSLFEGEFEIPSQDGEDNIYGCINATPATKEQRDLLFQKDKKEPKKIDDYCRENCKGFQETGKCFFDDECAAKKAYKQKSAKWSEEDEKMIDSSVTNLVELMHRYGKEYGNVGKCIDWLKSLKQRIGG